MAKMIERDPSGKGRRIGIVVGAFNEIVSRELLDGCETTLRDHGVADADMTVVWVPGAFEIPLVAKKMAESGRFHGVICLGAIIRGQTPHFEYISRETAHGIAEVSRQAGLPVIFGVLTTENTEQALARAEKNGVNRGSESARAALKMVQILERLDREGSRQ